MQGKILIVDGISTNRIVLKVKLAAAFYQVLQASTIAEALDIVARDKPDLVVSAVCLPDGSAVQLCKSLRGAHGLATVPVLAIGGDVDTQVRLEVLRSGAFDVMKRPISETLLLGRVRTMIRAHHKLAEWQVRDDALCAMDFAEAPTEFLHPDIVALIGLDAAPLQGWGRQMLPHLRARYTVAHLRDAMVGLHTGAPADAVVLALPNNAEAAEESLRLIPALRASAQTRDTALLVIQKSPDPARATSALDMGADDVMIAGFDAPEVALRLQALLRRKRQVAHMMDGVRTGLREVMHDPLTSLYNRRYATPYLSRLIEQSTTAKSPFAVILADMDYFKRVNDVYGHTSGDAVLVETARRLRAAVRPNDMVARMGGEEFLIALPATDMATARTIAGRLCEAVGGQKFAIPGAKAPVSITMSLGLTSGSPPLICGRRALESVNALVDRADKALYGAKMEGRNRVGLQQPHSRPAA
jgi:two-component system cell cycle response regulator